MALLMHHFFSAPRIRIGATRTFTDTTPIARKNLHHLRVLNVRAPPSLLAPITAIYSKLEFHALHRQPLRLRADATILVFCRLRHVVSEIIFQSSITPSV